MPSVGFEPSTSCAATLDASGGRCARCGASGVRLYAHHPHAVRAGGPVEGQLGVALCARCHPRAERA